MRSLVSALRAARSPEQTKTPVPYASSYAGYGSLLAPSGDEAQLRAAGDNGTLFAIVDAYATAMSGVEWNLYRQLPPEAAEGTERQAVPGHPALDLWNYINAHYDQPLFVATVTQHLELVGTGYVVVVKAGTLPVELWPVMPHRMEIVPHKDRFIAGYVYHGPNGERVPLGNDAVIRLVRTPCPWDPYRGLGAVQTVLRRLQSAAAAEQWHRNFFVNSARPDGVIQVPQELSDTEFEQFNLRWKEAHQGVQNAHRVAILEYGAQWKPTGYSPQDMQFAELDRVDAEKIREAYRISDTVMGKGQALNRATAEAQLFDWTSNHVVPRCEAVWKKTFLNGRLLPMYGPTGRGLEFRYTSPVPEDKEAWREGIVAQATAFEKYVGAGVAGDDPEMLRHLRLPPMKMAPTPPPPAVPGQPAPEPEARLVLGAGHRHGRGPRRAVAAADDDEPDLSGVLTDLETALERLEGDYQPTLDRQIDSLVDQVRRAVDAGVTDDATAISGIAVPPELLGEDVVRRAMDRMATTAADRAAGETAAEDVTVDEDDLASQLDEDTAETGDVATAVTTLAAANLAASAAGEALRLWQPGAVASSVAAAVGTYLRGLVGVERRTAFGAALHRATNLGRGAAFTLALKVRPGGRATAFEQNDRNTCGPCSEINGHVFGSLEDAQLVYGGGGYHACLGKWRCRGTYHVTWS